MIVTVKQTLSLFALQLIVIRFRMLFQDNFQIILKRFLLHTTYSVCYFVEKIIIHTSPLHLLTIKLSNNIYFVNPINFIFSIYFHSPSRNIASQLIEIQEGALIKTPALGEVFSKAFKLLPSACCVFIERKRGDD